VLAGHHGAEHGLRMRRGALHAQDCVGFQRTGSDGFRDVALDDRRDGCSAARLPEIGFQLFKFAVDSAEQAGFLMLQRAVGMLGAAVHADAAALGCNETEIAAVFIWVVVIVYLAGFARREHRRLFAGCIKSVGRGKPVVFHQRLAVLIVQKIPNGFGIMAGEIDGDGQRRVDSLETAAEFQVEFPGVAVQKCCDVSPAGGETIVSLGQIIAKLGLEFFPTSGAVA